MNEKLAELKERIYTLTEEYPRAAYFTVGAVTALVLALCFHLV